MGDGERSPIVAENGVEDLADRQERAVNAAFAYQNDSPEVMRGVADEHDRSLAGRAPQLTHRNGGDVSCGPQPQWNRIACSEAGQTKRRGESGRLVGSDAGESS